MFFSSTIYQLELSLILKDFPTELSSGPGWLVNKHESDEAVGIQTIDPPRDLWPLTIYTLPYYIVISNPSQNHGTTKSNYQQMFMD